MGDSCELSPLIFCPSAGVVNGPSSLDPSELARVTRSLQVTIYLENSNRLARSLRESVRATSPVIEEESCVRLRPCWRQASLKNKRHTRRARGHVPDPFWGLPNCEQA